MSVFSKLSDKQLREQVIALIQPISRQLSGMESLSDIANNFGLKVREGKLPADKDGAYIENEKTIILNSNVTSEERKLFSFYHELAHHILRENDDLYSYLHEAYVDSNDFDNIIELLCNVGAAEFILPRDKVRSLIDINGFSIGLVQEICNQGCVSGPAALIQLIQNAPHHCYGVLCNYGVSPSRDNPNQQSFVSSIWSESLYIQYAIWSPSAQYTIARFTVIPGDHMLFKAISEETIISGKDRIPFRSRTKWSVPCEVLRFRNNIYALFNVNPPPNKLQPRLF